MCGRGGYCCQKGGEDTKLAKVNLSKGFYVQDVLPAQLKTFVLARKENDIRLITANRCTICHFWSAQRNLGLEN